MVQDLQTDLEVYTDTALQILQQLIAIPSISREEQGTAAALLAFLKQRGIAANRLGNNVWAANKHFQSGKPTILLNSHHDTVKPAAGYTLDPYAPIIRDGKLFGLGSNDAGGALVSLLAAFLKYYDRADLKYNLVFAATAEEEISGAGGVASLLPHLEPVWLGIVGEPTQMKMAIAEKGLLVLDCEVKGVPGHAARDEGENALYAAMEDIAWFRNYSFPRVSDTLGKVKMTVTIIQAGSQHNVIPGSCTYTVDIRNTEQYSHEELLAEIRAHVKAEVRPRSLRLQPSGILANHPVVLAGARLGWATFGSPTLSDQALMNFDTIKIGPGDSARSHTADEFIYLSEIEQGISGYCSLLEELNNTL